MPRGNRTGPLGSGPMSGRGTGYCAGFPTPGFLNPGWGYAACRGYAGDGWGWRHMFYATGLPGWMRYGRTKGWMPSGFQASSEEETTILKRQAEILRNELEHIQRRLDELEKTE